MSWSEALDEPKAWGKVILVGEHAVVYGHAAVAGAIDRGLRCSARESAGSSRLRAAAWHIDVSVGDDHPVARALEFLLAETGRRDLELEVEGDLPAAAGLGSSAALCVAVTRALRPELAGDTLRALANRAETCFHDRPSGIDVALSTQGGFGVYRTSTGLRPLPCAPLTIVVGLSGLPRSTATMVSGVAERMKSSAGVRECIESIGGFSARAEEALLEADHHALGALMDQCHEKLQAIGVSVDVLDRMVRAARDAGALGAKLTGAGGGGSIIALAPGKELAVMKAMEELGHQSFMTTLGACA